VQTMIRQVATAGALVLFALATGARAETSLERMFIRAESMAAVQNERAALAAPSETSELGAETQPLNATRFSLPGQPDTHVVAQAIQGIGMPVTEKALEGYRGGTGVVVNEMRLRGVVADNAAIDVTTGSNVIRDGAFAHMSGIPTVVQNSGANVLIQSATIVNVQFQAP
jgi:hypothetical protein